MEKLTQTSINSILFSLEDSAYNKLSSYIDEIHAAFKNEIGGQEIIKDIEARIAEHFKDKNKEVLSISDIDEVISIMGSVSELTENIKEDKEKSSETSRNNTERRFYRDEDNAILGGVCAGISAYFNIDVVWVRIIFILFALLSFGTIAVIYLILWLIIPAAETTAEKIEMKGAEANINNIVNEVRLRINEFQDNHKNCKHNDDCNDNSQNKTFKIRHKILEVIKKIISSIGFIVRLFIGIALTATGLGIIIGSSVGMTIALTIDKGPNIQNFLTQSGALQFLWLGIATVAVTIIIPSAAMILGGITVIRKKPIAQIRYGFAIFGIWLLSLIVSVILMTHFGILFSNYTNSHGIPRSIDVKQIIISDIDSGREIILQ